MINDPRPDWFVANVRDLSWQENELGATCEFDKHRERFDEFGINLTVLRPGQPMTMYHREGYQEGFLVLRGECLLIVEGKELRLCEWDYFHCPRNVAHAIVGSGANLSLVLGVGSRVGPDVILYPRDETALKHGAGVEDDTTHPGEAYAQFTRPAPQVRFRKGMLGLPRANEPSFHDDEDRPEVASGVRTLRCPSVTD
jgi:uncharacterized cupin superfamily protein